MRNLVIFSVFCLFFVACGTETVFNRTEEKTIVETKNCNDLGCPRGVCNSQYGICEIEKTVEVVVEKKCNQDNDCSEGVCDTTTGICVKTETIEKTVFKKCEDDNDCNDDRAICNPETGICVKTENTGKLTLALTPGEVTTNSAEIYWIIRNSVDGTIQNLIIDCESDGDGSKNHFEIATTAGSITNMVKFEGLKPFLSYSCVGRGTEESTGTTVTDVVWFMTKYEEPVMTYCTYGVGDTFPDKPNSMGIEITSPLWEDNGIIASDEKDVAVAKFNIKTTNLSAWISRMRFTAVNNGSNTEEEGFELENSNGLQLAVNPPPIIKELIDFTILERYEITWGSEDSFTVKMANPSLHGKMTLYLERLEYTDGYGVDCITVFKNTGKKSWSVNFE